MSSIDAVRTSRGTARIDAYNSLFGISGKDFFQHLSDSISSSELSDNTKLRDYIFRVHGGRDNFSTLNSEGVLDSRFFNDTILDYIRTKIEEKRRVSGALRRAAVVMPSEPEKPVLSDVVRKYLPVEIADTWDTKLNSTERGIIVGLGALALAFGGYKALGAINDTVGGNTFLPKGKNWFTSTLYGAAYLFAGYHIANAGSKFFLNGEAGEIGGIDATINYILDSLSGDKDAASKRMIERQRKKIGITPGMSEEAMVTSAFAIQLMSSRKPNQFNNLSDFSPSSSKKEIREAIDTISKRFSITPQIAAERLRNQIMNYRDNTVLKGLARELGVELTLDEFTLLAGTTFGEKLNTLEIRTKRLTTAFKAGDRFRLSLSTIERNPTPGYYIDQLRWGDKDEFQSVGMSGRVDLVITYPKNIYFEFDELKTSATEATIKDVLIREGANILTFSARGSDGAMHDIKIEIK